MDDAISYRKVDLLWEAIRRNEEYKSFYNQVVGSVNDKESKWNRIWHPGNLRWKIHGLLHPSLSIDDIYAKIKAGADPNEVHPYHYMFESEQNAIIQHHVPKIESDDYDNPNMPHDGVKISSADYKKYQEFITITKDRILLSINPMASDKILFEEIKKLKKSKRHILKQNLKELKSKGKRSYYPRDIGKYIGWLKKYTEIVEYLNKEIGPKGLTVSNGVITLPDNFSFSEVVPSSTPGKKFAGKQKAYKTAYVEAVELIRSSPNLKFSAYRTNQLNQ